MLSASNDVTFLDLILLIAFSSLPSMFLSSLKVMDPIASPRIFLQSKSINNKDDEENIDNLCTMQDAIFFLSELGYLFEF